MLRSYIAQQCIECLESLGWGSGLRAQMVLGGGNLVGQARRGRGLQRVQVLDVAC